ncbi:MAG: hypothetical protein AAFX53_19220, partial [Bacteroidota bacterium]
QHTLFTTFKKSGKRKQRMLVIVHYLLRFIFSLDKEGYIKARMRKDFDAKKITAVDYIIENEKSN